jgi:hypothetical protein
MADLLCDPETCLLIADLVSKMNDAIPDWRQFMYDKHEALIKDKMTEAIQW